MESTWAQEQKNIGTVIKLNRILRVTRNYECLLRRKKIKSVTEQPGFRSIDFCVSASRACNGREFFVLYVKNFGQEPSCRSKLIYLVLMMMASCTSPIFMLHSDLPELDGPGEAAQIVCQN